MLIADRAAWLVLLLAAPVTLADPTIATVGPRVTIQAEGMPLAELTRRIGQQINRSFGGALLENAATAQRPVDLRLFGATVAQTLEALREAVPCHLVRTGLGVYGLQSRGSVPRASRALGDWTASITWLRYSFSSQLYPGDLGRTSRSASLMPSLEVEAPSDGDSMRLLALGPTGATTDGGEELAPQGQRPVLAPSRGDPSTWMLSQPIAAPSLPATRLAELRCDLSFFDSLTEAGFEFRDLARPEAREATDRGYTARLAARVPGEGGGLLRLTVTGPIPAGLEPNQVTAVLGRTGWGEGWLYSEAGEVTRSETRLDGFTAKEGLWETTWSVIRVRPAEDLEPTDLALATPPPARLVFVFRIPAGPITTRRVTFQDLPLPPREGELAP